MAYVWYTSSMRAERSYGRLERPALVRALPRFLIWLCLLLPGSAWGYVDPGVVGSFYQLAYVLVFGVLLGILRKPLVSLNSLFSRVRSEWARRRSGS